MVWIVSAFASVTVGSPSRAPVAAWASRGLETGEISDDQYKFVTNFENCHPAVPKPLYKTHKVDEEGRLLDPVPIRNLTV